MAGEPVKPANSMFLPNGKSDVEDAYQAQANSRCVARYGPGYWSVGGGDTCVRLGGSVGVTVGTGSKRNQLIAPSQGIAPAAPSLGGPAFRAPALSFAPPPPAVGAVKRSRNGALAATTVYIDSKTQTEMGDINAHISVRGAVGTKSAHGPDYIQR